MKAVRFEQHGGPEVLRLEQVAEPTAGPGEVLVRVRACGVNRLDLFVREGSVPVKVPLPHISGSEVAGELAAIGPGVQALAEGQRVAVFPYLHCGACEYCLAGEPSTCLRSDILGLISDGGYAELVKVPANAVQPLPDGLGFEQAAALSLAAMTAWHMLERARLAAGETALVLAAGSGVGSAAIQIARLRGARVIATATSDAKLERARELGAQEVVNTEQEDLREAVRRLSGRRGVDVVVEHVGQATWPASVASLARNGRLVTCGATTGSQVSFDLWPMFAKQISFIGCYGGTPNDLRQVLQAAARGDLQPVIDRTLPLEQLAEAQQALAAREQFGKIVISSQ
jgi:NADPH:quinone reductase-like Zn-dependent oxidoreductase